MNNKNFLLLFLIIANKVIAQTQPFPWAVVGAGPAGIIAIALLLDNGVHEQDIVWLDPEFKVGRLGKYYQNVPSNQKAYRFTHFITSCSQFNNINSPAIQAVKEYNQEAEPYLQLIVNALQDVTDNFCSRILSYDDTVQSIMKEQNHWQLELAQSTIIAHKVILATGSHPKRKFYKDIEEIPLDLALDKDKLMTLTNPEDSIMVIGSSHSALLILQYLSTMPIKKIISIYTKLPQYAVYGGLEGFIAHWVKEVLEKNPPLNLERIVYSPTTIETYKNSCNKIIYAFGYQRNQLLINGTTKINFNSNSGVIDNNLYGIGIAFPNIHISEEGMFVPLIGLNSFMEYGKNLIPQWIKD